MVWLVLRLVDGLAWTGRGLLAVLPRRRTA